MITLAITTYERTDLTVKSFSKVIGNDKIHEIIIVDDHSSEAVYSELVKKLLLLGVAIYRNSKNLGMMLNKREAVMLAKSDWVIILDSDNVIDASYLNAIPKNLDPNVIYCPSFARPTFNYRKFAGAMIGVNEAKKMLSDRMGNACLNTCNYLVHRETYLSVFKEHDVKGTDTIAFNYEWLKAGKKFYIVPGMEYDHLVHDGSGFMKDVDYNMKKAEEYKQKIMRL